MPVSIFRHSSQCISIPSGHFARMRQNQHPSLKAAAFSALPGIADKALLEKTHSSFSIRLEEHINNKLRGASARRERITALLTAFRNMSEYL